MRPENGEESDTVPSSEDSSTGFDSQHVLQRATEDSRADIVADIIGHPKGMPSVEELKYMNPGLSDDAIRRHLAELAQVGVVENRSFEADEGKRELHRDFYELTTEAREVFDRNGLFPRDTWQRQYAAVEKTARIREIEELPRP